VPKVEKFRHLNLKKIERHAAQARALRKRLRCVGETIILGILDHLLLQALFIVLKTLPGDQIALLFLKITFRQ
jgi:hypothetical protein